MTWKTAEPHAEALRGRRILVVEDEPLIALEIGALLADEGALVVGPGHTVTQSAKLAREAELSAALLDVRLGNQTAAPIAKILSDRGVPFAFYTGQAESDAVRCQWPSAPVIPKPSPARKLVSAIEKLCDGAGDGPRRA